MEEVTYNYKTCDRWWQNRRNFMFRSHKKSFWFYKAGFSVIWILLQYRGRNWSSLNFISGEGCHSSPFLSSLKHELVNDLDIHNRRILLMNVIITLIISILFIIGIILLIMGLIKLIKNNRYHCSSSCLYGKIHIIQAAFHILRKQKEWGSTYGN